MQSPNLTTTSWIYPISESACFYVLRTSGAVLLTRYTWRRRLSC